MKEAITSIPASRSMEQIFANNERIEFGLGK